MKDLILSLNRLGTNGKRKLVNHITLIIIALLFHSWGILYCAKAEETEKIGNFLLPTSQMPGPLYGFGQNIVDQHDFQFFFYVLQRGGKNVNFTDFIPGILYGIRDDLSLFTGISFTPLYKADENRSRGVEDLFAQLEYTLYSKTRQTSAAQATIIGNITLPTGSSKKNPPTGFGSPSFFLAATLSYTAHYWYIWLQGGAQFTTKHHGTKFGNQFLYQSGIEGVIATPRSKWLIAWMVEFFGTYEQKSRICNLKDPNTGGNTFYIGPSLWASSKKWLIQLGIAFAPAQHLFGEQPKIKYFLESYIAYKFN